MATIVANSGPLDMSKWDFGSITTDTVTSSTATQIVLAGDTNSFTFNGTGFGSPNFLGIPQEGTITGAVIHNATETDTITGLHLSVGQLISDLAGDNPASLETDLLSGADKITGGSHKDVINGFAGADTIKGGGASDMLTGGSGKDTFVYGKVSDSTGTTYDKITDFDASQDKIDLTVKVTGIDKAITTGALSSSTFVSQLTAAEKHLHIHHAEEFTANSGNLKGHHFLVVDLNGKVGFQSGHDLVIDFGTHATNMSHLSVHDFV